MMINACAPLFLALLLGFLLSNESVVSFSVGWYDAAALSPNRRRASRRFRASVAEDQQDTSSSSSGSSSSHDPPSSSLKDSVLQTMQTLVPESNEYAEMFGLGPAEAAFYCLFGALREIPLGLKAKGCFCLRNDAITNALQQQESGFPGFFTMQDLEQAVTADFLDAARGSTDNRKGWKVRCGGYETVYNMCCFSPACSRFHPKTDH